MVEAEFACVRCGKCCLGMSMQISVPDSDIEMWRDAERHDILEWVDTSIGDIWMNKYTSEEWDGTCPWLRRDNDDKLYCSIHDVRPTACREYGPNDHALNTGCTARTGDLNGPHSEDVMKTLSKTIPKDDCWGDIAVDFVIRVPDIQDHNMTMFPYYLQLIIENSLVELEQCLIGEGHTLEDFRELMKHMRIVASEATDITDPRDEDDEIK